MYGEQEELLRFCGECGGGPLKIERTADHGNGYMPYWIFVLLSSMVLTLYDISLLRKEVLLRMISGQNLKFFVLRQTAKELAFYSICFLLSMLSFCVLSCPSYYLRNGAVLLLLIGIGNGLLYFLLLFTDYKKDMHIGTRARRILKISYVYKTIGVVVTLVVVAGCVRTIADTLPFYQQKEVFADLKEYSYYQMNVDADSGSFDRSDGLRLKLYQEYLGKGKTFTMVELQDPGSYDDHYIYADAGALPYLKQELPELDAGALKEQTVYALYPVKYQKNRREQENTLRKIFETYYDGAYQLEMLPYESNVKLLACDGSIQEIGTGATTMKENPIVLLNLLTENAETVDPYVLQSAMLDITDEEWNAFAEQNGISGEPIYKTNVWKNFSKQWEVKKASAFFSAALILCMFLIEGILLFEILKYEFYVHAQELVLKKIHGYPFTQRYRNLVMMTFMCTLAGTAGVSFFTWYSLRQMLGTVVIAAVAVLLIEAVLILALIRNFEQKNLRHILKGSVL